MTRRLRAFSGRGRKLSRELGLRDGIIVSWGDRIVLFERVGLVQLARRLHRRIASSAR